MSDINSFQHWMDTQVPFAKEQHDKQVKDHLAQMAMELATNCSKFGLTLEEVMQHAIDKTQTKHQDDPVEG
jgi:hypothetical protein